VFLLRFGNTARAILLEIKGNGSSGHGFAIRCVTRRAPGEIGQANALRKVRITCAKMLPTVSFCVMRSKAKLDRRVQFMPDFASRRVMMVDTQVRPSDVTKFPIIAAMLDVPRERFVPADRREAAYAEDNVPLKAGRVLLEARTLAKMLDALDIQPGDLVLDIATGLGYSAAVMAKMAEAVVAVEEDEGLASEAEAALAAAGADNAVVVTAPLTQGAPKHGPYDIITLQGAVEIVPKALTDQLKEGGRIACLFMDGELGVCRIGLMIGGQVNWRDIFNAAAPVLPGFAREREFVL
jgi:protein-L-isoaspartate(D-aspartate) O-methyltransferase